MMPKNCTSFAGPRNFPTVPPHGAHDTAQCLPDILLGRSTQQDVISVMEQVTQWGQAALLQGLSHNTVTNHGAVPVSLRQQPVVFEGYKLGRGISATAGATALRAASSRVQAGEGPVEYCCPSDRVTSPTGFPTAAPSKKNTAGVNGSIPRLKVT